MLSVILAATSVFLNESGCSDPLASASDTFGCVDIEKEQDESTGTYGHVVPLP